MNPNQPNPITPMTAPATGQPDPMQAFQQYALPDQISTLPAFGWWLLAMIGLAAIMFGIYAWRQHYQHCAAKRLALSALANLPATANPLAGKQILKRALLSYLPREQVADSSGLVFSALLKRYIKTSHHSQFDALFHAYSQDDLYQASPSPMSTEQRQLCQQWLKQALPIKNSGDNHV